MSHSAASTSEPKTIADAPNGYRHTRSAQTAMDVEGNHTPKPEDPPVLSQENGCAPEENRDINCKRTGYLEWPEYFMAICFLSAMRSKDPVTQVGACIVNDDRRVVGIGYNGMPFGCSDDHLPWRKQAEDPLDTKYMYVCHAEMNAILNKNSADVKGCTIYVALFPCNECAKLIIQSGIRKVVYLSDKHHSKSSTVASRRLLRMAGVECCQFVPPRRRIVIDFDVINWNSLVQVPDSPPREEAPPPPSQAEAAASGAEGAPPRVESAIRDLSSLMTDAPAHAGMRREEPAQAVAVDDDERQL